MFKKLNKVTLHLGSMRTVQSVELYDKIPNIVSAYDYIIYNCVNLYVEISFSIGQEVFKQANKVKSLF